MLDQASYRPLGGNLQSLGCHSLSTVASGDHAVHAHVPRHPSNSWKLEHGCYDSLTPGCRISWVLMKEVTASFDLQAVQFCAELQLHHRLPPSPRPFLVGIWPVWGTRLFSDPWQGVGVHLLHSARRLARRGVLGGTSALFQPRRCALAAL